MPNFEYDFAAAVYAAVLTKIRRMGIKQLSCVTMKLHFKMSIESRQSRCSICTPTRSHLQLRLRQVCPEKNGPFGLQKSASAPREIICDTPSGMTCDARTCGSCRYLEQDEQDDGTSLAEFLANCQQAKCKVVRLVRQQISKLQNMQYERLLDTSDETREKMRTEMPIEMHDALNNEVHEVYGEIYEPYDDPHEVESKVEAFSESYDDVYEAQKAAADAERTVGVTNAVRNAATASLRRAASPGRAVDRKWMLRILDRVRHRARLILAAAAVGVIVWTALVYGVFLGATACGSSRTCFRSSLRYTHAKRTLF